MELGTSLSHSLDSERKGTHITFNFMSSNSTGMPSCMYTIYSTIPKNVGRDSTQLIGNNVKTNKRNINCSLNQRSPFSLGITYFKQ